MTALIACVVEDHDLLVVALAALVCVTGAWATIRLFERVADTRHTQKIGWLILAAVTAGATIWCTHFIAMLGYDPGVPVSFDPALTAVSLLMAVLGVMLGFGASGRARPKAALLVGGPLIGLAISATHYTGMIAYRVQGIVAWEAGYLIGSILLAMAFSSLALHIVLRFPARRVWAAASFALAIVGLHFTGMVAFRVEPLLIEGSYTNPAALQTLAIAIAGVALTILSAGFASHLVDSRVRGEASEALRNMSNGLVVIDRDETIRLHNDRVRELFNLRPGDVETGMKLKDYLRRVGGLCGWSEERIGRVLDNHRIWMEQGGTTRVEHHFDDGKILSISCRPIETGGAVLTYDDVTEAREGQKQITHMAFHDALTGLSNRRSFIERLESLAREQSVTLLMLDLDRFKDVNDTFGHAAGDKLLKGVAQRLRRNCRPEDMIFRLGGDELAIIARPGGAAAKALADSLIAALSAPFQIEEHAVSIGCSIGLATAEPGADPESIQQMADLALYKAKESGRNRAEIYQQGMIEKAAQKRRLEQDLSRAAQLGQLELHYQPLYDLPGRRLSGFEALLRWRHPERGPVSPAEFIPVAEQTGAIHEIGAWVIEEACRQAAQWPQDLYVSINVSPVQLSRSNLLWQLTQAMDRHGMLPRRIEIEVTETALVENCKQIAATLAGLRMLGVRIAMDDFGTGYSSLAHIREFELDRIKIDRSFISSAHNNAGSAAIVRAVTGLARDLNIATTGEGIESEEQLVSLISLGCSTAQGYLLGKPLDAQSATALVESQSARKAASTS